MSRIQTIILAFCLTLISAIYIHNLSRFVYGGDTGDIVTAAYVFGVPHPSGYPLLTFLGYLFTHLPGNATPIFKMGLLSVLCSIGALFFFFKTIHLLLKNFTIALLSMLILAFSYIFWIYVEIPEVFALNNFFIALQIYLAVLFYKTRKPYALYFLIFACAMSLTHHMTILALFPGLFILISKHLRWIFSDRKRILYLTLCGLAGFLPFLYIPLAASLNPPINWNNASSFSNFFHLILRRDYGYAGQSFPFHIRFFHLKDYFLNILISFTIPVVLLCTLGAVELMKKEKRILLSLITSFILSGPVIVLWGANTNTGYFWLGILERFHIFSHIILLIFLPFGLLLIQKITNKIFPNKLVGLLVIMEFFLIPFLLFKYNFPKTNLSNTKIGEQFALDIINPLPQHSVVFLNGDTKMFNVWYVYYVLGIRSDIDIVNLAGSSSNGGYYASQRAQFSKKNPLIKRPSEITKGVFLNIKKERPVFSVVALEDSPQDMTWIPKGLVYELIKKNEIPTKEQYVAEIDSVFNKYVFPNRKDLTLPEKNLITSSIPTEYSDAVLNTADFIHIKYQDISAAKKYYEKALEIDHENPRAYVGLGVTSFLNDKNCKEAEKYMQKAIQDAAFIKVNHLYLYAITLQCFDDEEKLKKVEENYYKIFDEPLDSAIKKSLNATLGQ